MLMKKSLPSLRRALLRIVCLLVTLSPAVAVAQPIESPISILVISSYNPDTRRLSNFIEEFERQITATGFPCDISVENLECKGVAGSARWLRQVDRTIQRYERRNLRAIILLGQEAWASFVSLGRIPKNVMCFAGFVSENGVLLPSPADTMRWLPKSVNFSKMSDSLPNVGGVLNRYDVVRNIEMIRSIYPNTQTIAFVSDNTYGGISLQALVRKEFEQFKDLDLVLIDSRDGEEAAHRQYASLPPQSVAVIGTWRVGADGEYLMQRSLTELVRSNRTVPVFTITGTGLGDVAVGGYIPEYQNGARAIAAQIKSGLKKNKKTKA